MTTSKKVAAKKTSGMPPAKSARGQKTASAAGRPSAEDAPRKSSTKTSSGAKSGAKKASAKTSSSKSSSRKYSPEAGKSVEREMKAMHEGKLKSGGSGKKVTNPKQAIAIGLSEARRAGAKVPSAPGT